MSLKTVASYKDSVAAMLSGIDLTNIDDLNGALERAARTLIQKADVPEASGIQNVTLYSGVFDYACDPRIFGTAINDIRPQGITRNPSDMVSKIDQEDFDRTKGFYPSGTISTFQYNNGVPLIRIVAPFTVQQVIIDPMTSTTGWVAAGTASNLALDTAIYYQSPASLRFNLTTGAGTLTKTLSSPLSMSSYEDVGVAFLAIQIPNGATATNLTDIRLKLGSSSTNYDLVTSTTGFLGAWVSGEWLLVAFDFSGSVSTGIPNWSSIQYAQITLDATGSFTNFRVGGLWISLPSSAQILYQSAAIFLVSGSTSPTTTITEDTDIIILNDPAYTLYEFEGALSVLGQTGAGAADSTVARLHSVLNGARARNGAIIEPGLYDLYRGDNPSQEIRTSGSWYDNGSSYNSYGGY